MIKPTEENGQKLPQEAFEIIKSGPLKYIMELSLVLASQKILHRITYQTSDYVLEVHPDSKQSTIHLLALYEQENRDWNTQLNDTGDLRLSPTPFLFLVIPTLVFFIQNIIQIAVHTYLPVPLFCDCKVRQHIRV